MQIELYQIDFCEELRYLSMSNFYS